MIALLAAVAIVGGTVFTGQGEGIENADLLVAYPLVGPSLAALGETARRFPSVRLSVLSEEAARIEEIPDAISIFVAGGVQTVHWDGSSWTASDGSTVSLGN